MLVASSVAGRGIEGQEVNRRPSPRPEGRVDYLGPNPHAVHVGVGVNIPVGTYLRLGAIGGVGSGWVRGNASLSARADLVARFTFDPLRERRWGVSAGGGVSARYDRRELARSDAVRLLVAVLIDLEGPRAGAVSPAFQIGLGGGTRFGVVVRSADRFRR